MGVRAYINGIVDFSKGKHKKMFDVRKACDKAGTEYPKEMVTFFEKHGPEDWEEVYPEEDGLATVSIRSHENGDVYTNEGLTVMFKDLPKEIIGVKVTME